MSAVPSEPWLDSDAAKAIGPIEMVRGPALRQFAAVLWWVLVMGFAPACLGMFCLIPCHPMDPRLRDGSPGIPIAPLVLVWVCLAAWSIYWGVGRLRWRLLLGQHGVAIWRPGRATVVRWDELGTVWHRSLIDPGLPTDGLVPPLVLVRKGDRLVITRYFADYHLVIRRILDELHQRTLPDVDWRPSPNAD